jgi:hypothetical protein
MITNMLSIRTEVRRQKTENRGQGAEDRRMGKKDLIKVLFWG